MTIHKPDLCKIKSQTCCWSHSHCSKLNMSHSHCSRPVSHSHCFSLTGVTVTVPGLLDSHCFSLTGVTVTVPVLLESQLLLQSYWSHSHCYRSVGYSQCSSLTGVTVTAPDLLELQSLFHLLVTVTVPVSLESQSLLRSNGVTVTVCSSLAEVNVPNLKQ